jgi:outer membrane protein TolC
LNALKTDNAISLEKLNFFIQSKEQYLLQSENFYHFFSENFPTNFAGNPLVMEQLEQQKAIENAKLNAEKSKLLPSISLGINSMTMAGNSNNSNSRFQSGMLGIALPIFNSGQKSIIEGQKINQQIAENNQKISKKNMEIQYSLLQNEYKKLKAEQEYYLTKGLKNGEVILQTAHQQFYGGEINYLEWSILVNQSLEINNKYIDNQKLLNDKIIEINSLEEKL